MTESIPAFVLRMLSVTEGLKHNPGRMLLIVRRPYAQLKVPVSTSTHRSWACGEFLKIVLVLRGIS